MKRLVNAYGVERALQIIGGHSTALDYPRERLALWTILKSRWPLLADYLADEPEAVAYIKNGEVPDELANDESRRYLITLFKDEEVRRVVSGEVLGVDLDKESLRLLIEGPDGARRSFTPEAWFRCARERLSGWPSLHASRPIPTTRQSSSRRATTGGPETEVFVEESVTEPPPPKRPVLWPWLLALLVLVLVGLGAAYFFTRDDDNDETTTTSTVATTTAQVTVPDVVGTTSSEATATLRGAGLDANLVSVPSDRSPGTVIAQNPSAGEEVSDGSTVRLNVAEAAKPAATTTAPETTAPTTTAAPEPATVPDVVGQELADAARDFNEEGLKVAVVYVPSNEPAGQRRGTGATAGCRAPGGRHRSAERLDRRRARARRAGSGCHRRETGRRTGSAEVRRIRGAHARRAETDDRSRVGSVLSQTPSGGANIPRGSLVLLYVGA